MSTEPSSASPTLKTITIRLSAEARRHDAETRQEIALSALAAALLAVNYSVSPAWTVQAVPGGESLLYELTQLSDQPVSAEMAWEMTYALRTQSQIATAEPTFVAVQRELSKPAVPAPARLARPAEADNHKGNRDDTESG